MKKTAIIAAAFALALPTFAQNVNQTVQVTNEYKTEMPDVQKQGVEMALPDSLLHFDYKFDYSVFETPYKGAYEFSPYQIHVQPDASVYDGRNLFLRAGAGYTMHPVLDVVYTPVSKDNFGVSIHNNGRGYYGGIHTLADMPTYINPEGPVYDFSDNFGVDMRWQLKKVGLRADAGYDGIFAGDRNHTLASLNSGFANARVNSVHSPFYYEFGLGYRYVNDHELDVNRLAENRIRIDGSIGQAFAESYRFRMDFLIEDDMFDLDTVPILMDEQTMEVFNGTTRNVALISAAPHVDFAAGIFNIRAGVKLGYAEKFTVSPDVRVSTNVIRDRMNVYVAAIGGQTLNSFYDLKSGFTFGSALYIRPEVQRELLHIMVGAQGSAGHHLQYGISGGNRIIKNASLMSINGYGPADVVVAYAKANAAWKSESFNAEGDISVSGLTGNKPLDVFSFPLVSGNFRAVYNWQKRFFAGVSLEGQTYRKGIFSGQKHILPGYVNLGVNLEYRFTSRFGVWVEGGNLLCQKIFNNPIYAEKAPALTAGISLRL